MSKVLSWVNDGMVSMISWESQLQGGVTMLYMVIRVQSYVTCRHIEGPHPVGVYMDATWGDQGKNNVLKE